MKVGELFVKMSVDMSGFRNDLDKSRKSVEEFGKRTESTFAKIKEGMKLAFGGALGFAGFEGIKQTISGIITSTADFEQAMTKVKVLSGASADEIKKLGESAKQLAPQMGFTAQQAADALAELAASGFNATQMADMLPAVLSAAAASGEDLGLASELVAGQLHSFGMQAQQASHVADVLAQAANISRLNLQDMNYSLKYAGPVAHAAGISFEELSAALAIMSNNMIEGEQAGTTIRAALLRLVDPPKEAKKALDALGISISDQHGKMRPLVDIIGQLQTKLKDATQLQREQALSMIFGTDAMSGMLALVNTGPDTLRKFTDELKNSDGASRKAAEAMQDTLAGSLKKLKAQFTELGKVLGDSVSPTIRSIADHIQNVVKWFNQLNPTLKEAIAKTTIFSTVFALLGGITVKFIMDIPRLVEGLGYVKKAIDLVGAAMKSAFGWIGILALATGLLYEAWVNDWGGIQEKTKAVAIYIQLAFRNMAIGISEMWNELSKVVWENVNKLLKWIKPVVDVLGHVAPGISDLYNKALFASSEKVQNVTLNLQKLRQEAEITREQLQVAANGINYAFSGLSASPKHDGFGDFRKLVDEMMSSASNLPDFSEGGSGLPIDFSKLGDSAEEAGKKAKKAAEDTRAAWEIAIDTLQSKLQILKAKYDLVTATMGVNVSESEKLSTQLKYLNEEYEIQRQIVDKARQGYEQMLATKGENAKETLDASQKYAQEAKSLSDLANQISETNLALQQQAWITEQVKTRMEELEAKQELQLARLDESAGKLQELQVELSQYNEKLQLQKELVQSLEREYQASINVKGKDAEETRKAYSELLNAQTEEAKLEKQIRQTNQSIKEQIAQFDNLMNQVHDTAQKYRNDLIAAQYEYQKKVNEVNQRLISDIQKANEDYQKAVEDRAKTLRNFVGLFDAVTPKEVSGQTLLENLRSQVTTFEQWQANLAALSGRGIDQGLVNELRSMGPQAAAEIAALNTLTDAQLSEYVSLWRKKNQDAKQEATSQLSDLAIQTQVKIAELRSQAAAQLEQYKAEWTQKTQEIKDNTIKKLQELVQQAAEQGRDMVTRLANAITAAMPQLAQAMQGLPGFTSSNGTDQVKQAQAQQAGVVTAAVQQKQGVIDATVQMTQNVIQTWTDTNAQLSNKTEEIKTKLITSWQFIQQQLSTLWQKMFADVTKTWNQIRGTLFDITNQIQVRFEGLVNASTHWGVSLMSNFIAGIQSQFNRLRETLVFMTMMVDSYMPHSPAKVGPLSRLDEWGPSLVGTFADGIRNSLPKLESVTVRMAALSPAALGPSISNVNNTSNSVNVNIDKIEISTTAKDPKEIYEYFKSELKRDLRKNGVTF
ncbi:phage tail tape measure protein [Kyrpidia sp.]|uniref:phage tail tape measure protein n=1 Tax=Kyrpidia sp. TaxID=2073077 RepID=UPI002582F8CC|nr:phage tail tape measure protein [Kyrpidia sp.]MCL6575562.1 phage tail tape measure protein [Kyrpidia sp.]